MGSFTSDGRESFWHTTWVVPSFGTSSFPVFISPFLFLPFDQKNGLSIEEWVIGVMWCEKALGRNFQNVFNAVVSLMV